MSNSHTQFLPNANKPVLNNVSFQHIEGNYYNGAGKLHTTFVKFGLTAVPLLTDPDLNGMRTFCFCVLARVDLLLHVNE